jgi:hypothetical protein
MVSSITFSVRCRDGAAVEDQVWSTASVDLLRSAVPWRTFRWFKGQKHYSGSYWSATTRSHVIYESRLELARLLFADFDPAVLGITAQPFLLKAEVEGLVRTHVPDCLLITENGPVVVDVKPKRQISTPSVTFTLGWAQRAVELRRWRYEAWCEPPEAEFPAEILEELRSADLDSVPLGQAARQLSERPEPTTRAAILHLLWTHYLRTDLTQPLVLTRVLRRTT